MATDAPVQGYKCKLYYDSADSQASPTWVLIKNAIDVNLPDSQEEVEVSARYADDKLYLAGQSDRAINFGYQYITGSGDTVFTALQTRKANRTATQFAWADGPIATTGTVYYKGWMTITQFDSAEELAGSKTFDITVKPTPHFTAGTLDTITGPTTV